MNRRGSKRCAFYHSVMLPFHIRFFVLVILSWVCPIHGIVYFPLNIMDWSHNNAMNGGGGSLSVMSLLKRCMLKQETFCISRAYSLSIVYYFIGRSIQLRSLIFEENTKSTPPPSPSRQVSTSSPAALGGTYHTCRTWTSFYSHCTFSARSCDIFFRPLFLLYISS